jgi:hypothetical protein
MASITFMENKKLTDDQIVALVRSISQSTWGEIARLLSMVKTEFELHPENFTYEGWSENLLSLLKELYKAQLINSGFANEWWTERGGDFKLTTAQLQDSVHLVKYISAVARTDHFMEGFLEEEIVGGDMLSALDGLISLCT